VSVPLFYELDEDHLAAKCRQTSAG
jgi:hypothetical protein